MPAARKPAPAAKAPPAPSVPRRDTRSGQEKFAALVAKGDVLARYVEKEGRWETHTAHTRAFEGGPTRPTERRVFVWPESAEAKDALERLGITPD